ISQRDPGAQMLSLHADWAVGDDRAFRSAARNALGVAHEYDVLVTVGVTPTRNDTAYGYIVPGKPLGSARAVRRFVEKPSAARAALLRRRGALWNTGLFAWGVARFLGEAGAYARELKAGWPKLSAGDIAGFFSAVQPVAVDVAVLERTKRLAVVAGTFRWDDIGSWDSLLRIRRPDVRGNVVVGNVMLGDDVRRSVIWSENEHLAGFVEPGVPAVGRRRPVAGPALIGSSTFVPRGLAPPLPPAAFRLSCNGVTVGWGVGPGATWNGPQAKAATVEVLGVVLHGAY